MICFKVFKLRLAEIMKYKNLLKYNNFLNFHENLIRKKTSPNLQN